MKEPSSRHIINTRTINSNVTISTEHPEHAMPIWILTPFNYSQSIQYPYPSNNYCCCIYLYIMNISQSIPRIHKIRDNKTKALTLLYRIDRIPASKGQKLSECSVKSQGESPTVTTVGIAKARRFQYNGIQQKQQLLSKSTRLYNATTERKPTTRVCNKHTSLTIAWCGQIYNAITERTRRAIGNQP